MIKFSHTYISGLNEDIFNFFYQNWWNFLLVLTILFQNAQSEHLKLRFISSWQAKYNQPLIIITTVKRHNIEFHQMRRLISMKLYKGSRKPRWPQKTNIHDILLIQTRLLSQRQIILSWGEKKNFYLMHQAAQYDFPQCIKLPAPKKRPKIAALPSVVCPIYLIFRSPGTCISPDTKIK